MHIDKGWILGGKFAWSKINTRDPNVTKFYILQIQCDGSYKLVELGRTSPLRRSEGGPGSMPGPPSAR